jgi:hypothetical protein
MLLLLVPFANAATLVFLMRLLSCYSNLDCCRALVHWYQSVPVKRGDISCLTILVDYISGMANLAVLTSDCCGLFLIVGAGTE